MLLAIDRIVRHSGEDIDISGAEIEGVVEPGSVTDDTGYGRLFSLH